MNVVILAAGKGTRMRSTLPKVLQPLAGKPMVQHCIDNARALGAANIIVVVGHGKDALISALSEQTDLRFIEQAEQLGTGHALRCALPAIDTARPTLVLYGDVPCIPAQTLQDLVNIAGNEAMAVLGSEPENPSGYGRFVLDAQGLSQIIEHADCTPEQQTNLRVVNTGVMVLPPKHISVWLNNLKPNAKKDEYYLTDCVAAARAAGLAVLHTVIEPAWMAEGANDKAQLASLECRYQAMLANDLMINSGVTIADPHRLDIRGNLQCEMDVSIDVGCVFEGKVTLAQGVKIGAHCVLKNCSIGAGAEILPFTYIENAVVGAGGRIGPYARLRPGTTLADDCHIGNFVELKNVQMASGSKANHLAYLGDATIGSKVNIGAGAITCNYDGANKHRTVIEDNVFVGSNVNLVAPITVGAGATLGAGSTISKNAPPEQLTVARSKQQSLSGWQRPVKQKKD